MERRPNYIYKITKTGRLSGRTIKELESDKEVNGNGKSHKDKKWQNLQRLKAEDNMWLEAKNIYSN